MPKDEKNFKRNVRARMQRTGERYSTARANREAQNVKGKNWPIDHALGDQQFLYIETRSGGAQSFLEGRGSEANWYWFSHEAVTQRWIAAPSGFGRMVRTPLPVAEWLTPGGETAWQRELELKSFTVMRHRLAPNPDPSYNGPYVEFDEYAYPHNGELPTNPTALEVAMSVRRDTEEDRPDSSGAEIRRLFHLVETLQPGACGALLNAAAALVAQQPGVEALGHARDRLGRTGLALGFDDTLSGQQLQMIFDPKNAHLLERRVTQRSQNQGAYAARRRRWEEICSRRGSRGEAVGQVRDFNGEAARLPRNSIAQYSVLVQTAFVGSMFSTPDGTLVPNKRDRAESPRIRATHPEPFVDPRLPSRSRPMEVVVPDDPSSLAGQFQLRCRNLIEAIRALGHEPRGWVAVINALNAAHGASYLLELDYVLTTTTWLVERLHPELTLEHELQDPKWTRLFSEEERSAAAANLAEAMSRLPRYRGTSAESL